MNRTTQTNKPGHGVANMNSTNDHLASTVSCAAIVSNDCCDTNLQVSQSNPTLVRAIGRWSLAALMVNSIIGSGVFGLPSSIAGLVGSVSPWAVLLAGLAVGGSMGGHAG